MSCSKRSSGRKSKVRNLGWTDFDHKQRENQGIGTKGSADPYPPIPKVIPSKSSITNYSAPGKETFVSVLCASLESAIVPHGMDAVSKERASSLIKTLKEANGWADLDLIEDVLASVDYNELQASNLLESMVSGNPKKVESGHDNLEEQDIVVESHRINGNCEVDGTMTYELKNALVPRFGIPVEPEWEEDDVYLNHRRDAIRMTRLASQHSRASNNAYLRGDHLSAHKLSLKAREEWVEAEELNNKAAIEILRCRNSNSDIWKIDLHGLHASEAVRALHNHLHEIESQLMMNRSVFIDGLSKIQKNTALHSHRDSHDGLKVDSETTKKRLFCQRRHSVLHVITVTTEEVKM